MIGKLSGTLQEKSPPQILIDCHGVGYELEVPMSTFCALPALGAPLELLTHLQVREDAHVLFGFATPPERQAFRQLIKISGIGPRLALALLSGLSVAELAQAVAAQEVTRLLKVPGVGKKTAERLLLELRGKLGAKLGPHLGSLQPGRSAELGAAALAVQHDIEQALLALGYSTREAQAALQALPSEVGVSDGIRLALKALTH